MRPICLPVLLSLAAGCKAPLQAPDTLDELCGFLFAHTADEDPEALQASLENLDVWMNANMTATLEGYAIRNISAEAADALDRGDNLEGLVGAAVGAESVNNVSDVTHALVWEKQEELYPGTYLEFERTVLEGDYDCFNSRACDWLEVDNEVVSSYPLGLTVSSRYIGQYRWIDLPDGRSVSIYRTWITEPPVVSFDFLDIKDQFYFGANIPMGNGEHTLRLLASWIVAEIGDTDIPEDFALNLVIDSLVLSNEEMDLWISENL